MVLYGVMILMGVSVVYLDGDALFGGVFIGVISAMTVINLGQGVVHISPKGVWIPFHRRIPFDPEALEVDSSTADEYVGILGCRGGEVASMTNSAGTPAGVRYRLM